ncbi:MAG: hypothetical protein WDZ85_02665 [Candidatus Paceibacterota bacterium]
MKTSVFPGTPEFDALPCCVQIEMRSPSSLIQNTLGPFTHKEAEDWLRQSGFVQYRPNLWLQDATMTMDYCETKAIELKHAHAWVYLLHKPEEVNHRKV